MAACLYVTTPPATSLKSRAWGKHHKTLEDADFRRVAVRTRRQTTKSFRVLHARSVSEGTDGDANPESPAEDEREADLVDNVPSKSARLGKGVNLVGKQ